MLAWVARFLTTCVVQVFGILPGPALGESEGMSTSGHRTNSTYKRYNIIDEDLQRSSLQRLYAGERASQSGPAQTGWTEVIGQTSDKRAIFEGRGKVIFLGQAHG